MLAVVTTAGFALYARDGVGATYATYYNHNGLDLKIDSRAYYNGAPYPKSTWTLKDLKPHADKFFKFWDVKPGDYGRTVISIHPKKSSAWACLTFENLKEAENGRNEPEKEEDTSGAPGSGELADGTEFFAWFDDGDTIYEVGEKALFGTTTQSAVQTLKDKTYPLADWKHGTAFPKDSTKYVGIAWCAGNLTVNLATAQISCDGSTLGNEAQTDSFTVDVSITAVPSRDEPKYLCNGKKEYPHYDHHDDYAWYDWNEGGHGYCAPSHGHKNKNHW